MKDPLSPSAKLLCKLGSIVVLADEGMSPTGHTFDVVTIRTLIDDAEVQEWIREMSSRALLPVKRR